MDSHYYKTIRVYRRRHDSVFKQNTVYLIEDFDRTVTKVAVNPGVSKDLLCKEHQRLINRTEKNKYLWHDHVIDDK